MRRAPRTPGVTSQGAEKPKSALGQNAGIIKSPIVASAASAQNTAHAPINGATPPIPSSNPKASSEHAKAKLAFESPAKTSAPNTATKEFPASIAENNISSQFLDTSQLNISRSSSNSSIASNDFTDRIASYNDIVRTHGKLKDNLSYHSLKDTEAIFDFVLEMSSSVLPELSRQIKKRDHNFKLWQSTKEIRYKEMYTRAAGVLAAGSKISEFCKVTGLQPQFSWVQGKRILMTPSSSSDMIKRATAHNTKAMPDSQYILYHLDKDPNLLFLPVAYKANNASELSYLPKIPAHDPKELMLEYLNRINNILKAYQDSLNEFNAKDMRNYFKQLESEYRNPGRTEQQYLICLNNIKNLFSLLSADDQADILKTLSNYKIPGKQNRTVEDNLKAFLNGTKSELSNTEKADLKEAQFNIFVPKLINKICDKVGNRSTKVTEALRNYLLKLRQEVAKEAKQVILSFINIEPTLSSTTPTAMTQADMLKFVESAMKYSEESRENARKNIESNNDEPFTWTLINIANTNHFPEEEKVNRNDALAAITTGLKQIKLYLSVIKRFSPNSPVISQLTSFKVQLMTCFDSIEADRGQLMQNSPNSFDEEQRINTPIFEFSSAEGDEDKEYRTEFLEAAEKPEQPSLEKSDASQGSNTPSTAKETEVEYIINEHAESLQEQITQFDPEENTVEKQLKAKEVSLAELKKQAEQLTKQEANIRQNISLLQNTIAELTREEITTEEQCKAKEETLADLRKQANKLATEEKAAKEHLQALKEATDQLANETTVIEEQYKAKEVALKQLQEQIAQFGSEENAAKERFRVLQEAIDQLANEETTIEEQRKVKEAALAELRNQAEKLTKQEASTRQSIESLQQAIGELTTDKNTAKERIQALQNTIGQLANEETTIEQQRDTKTEALTRLQARLGALTDEEARVSAYIKALESKTQERMRSAEEMLARAEAFEKAARNKLDQSSLEENQSNEVWDTFSQTMVDSYYLFPHADIYKAVSSSLLATLKPIWEGADKEFEEFSKLYDIVFQARAALFQNPNSPSAADLEHANTTLNNWAKSKEISIPAPIRFTSSVGIDFTMASSNAAVSRISDIEHKIPPSPTHERKISAKILSHLCDMVDQVAYLKQVQIKGNANKKISLTFKLPNEYKELYLDDLKAYADEKYGIKSIFIKDSQEAKQAYKSNLPPKAPTIFRNNRGIEKLLRQDSSVNMDTHHRGPRNRF